MYEIICEWDLGLGETIYANYDTAVKYATDALLEMGEDFEEIEDEGLICIQGVNVNYE